MADLSEKRFKTEIVRNIFPLGATPVHANKVAILPGEEGGPGGLPEVGKVWLSAAKTPPSGGGGAGGAGGAGEVGSSVGQGMKLPGKIGRAHV